MSTTTNATNTRMFAGEEDHLILLDGSTPLLQTEETMTNNESENPTEMESNTEVILSVPNEVDENGKYCIYIVPEFIRKENEECYRPLVISIGPVFYKDPKLEGSQKLKQYYLKCFREHPMIASQSLEPYIKFVRDQETEIRGCYEHPIDLGSEEFIEMMVLDAAFLVFLFLVMCGGDYRLSRDAKLENDWVRNFINRDVTSLQENQLPYFVLKGIYDIAFGAVFPRLSFTDLALQYLAWVSDDFPSPSIIESVIQGKKITDASSIKQLVDLRRKCCCIPFSVRGHDSKAGHPYSHWIYSAMQLNDAGVKFEVNGESHGPFDITFDKNSGVLKLPKVNLFDNMETIFRNLLFFEQCHGYKHKYFTDYFIFLDRLVNTKEDVQILQQNGILDNCLGSDTEAADLFNKLNKYVFFDSTNFAFRNVSKELKDYASAPRNKWRAILWSKYFNHPWAIISFIAAFIYFILTLLQTVVSFTAY